MKKLKQLKQRIMYLLVCKRKWHKWEYYTVNTGTGFYSSDIEQAGICVRCGYDTHGEYEL